MRECEWDEKFNLHNHYSQHNYTHITNEAKHTYGDVELQVSLKF